MAAKKPNVSVKRPRKKAKLLTFPAARELPVRQEFETVQIRNVPADEVGAVLAEEHASTTFVNATTHAEADGEFTIVVVHRKP